MWEVERIRRLIVRGGALLFVGAVVALLGVQSRRVQTVEDDGRVRVVASFYPLAEFARQVGGDRVSVVTVAPAGAESHDLEPTPRDVASTFAAALFLAQGGGFDPWAERVAPAAAARGVRVVAMVPAVAERVRDLTGDDPHLWLDPVLAREEVTVIQEALTAVDPAGAAAYARNADAYRATLRRLDDAYRASLSRCRLRTIITSHAAFGYLTRRYHLQMIPIAGLSSHDEPSPRHLSEIIRRAREEKIPVVFYEPLGGPKLAETIVREVGAAAVPLDPIEGIAPDALKSGASYLSLMEQNLLYLREALDCA